ncbi:MAG: hypothetical protein Fues2KO_12010 [Fuerstiella sp.]
MRLIRIVLLLALIPFATRLGPQINVALSRVTAVYADYSIPEADRHFRTAAEVVEPLHSEVGRPAPTDWLATVVEPGQTFAQYATGNPVTPTQSRNTLYVQPIGDFTAEQRRIVDLTAEYLSYFFSAPVEMLSDVPVDRIPKQAQRIHPLTQELQFSTSFIQYQLLKPDLPEDAIAVLALTATDLWPGGNTNFVFGQASLINRVGVWSMARFGDPSIGELEFAECLKRTIGTATHETGHMLSMRHCIFFNCNMSGSGSLAEADRHPLYLCPECLPKLHWATRCDPIHRFRKLADFCSRHNLHDSARYYFEAANRFQQEQGMALHPGAWEAM